jgi:hypothetical protein
LQRGVDCRLTCLRLLVDIVEAEYDGTGQRCRIRRVLRLTAREPQDAVVDHQRVEREQRDERNRDVNQYRATLTSGQTEC